MGIKEKIGNLFGKKKEAAPAVSAPASAAAAPAAPVKEKIKFAQYWGAACGGCDVALLDIDEKILDVAAIADIVFWPIAVDGKKKDVEAMEDGEITICLYNGAVRNSENLEMAKLLRQKSKILVAFGSCSAFGGIPGLANVSNREEILDYVYKQIPSMDNPDGVVPQTELETEYGVLDLPVLFDTVNTLDQVVDVDYYVPGCPPMLGTIETMLEVVTNHVVNGAPLPPKGTVIASDKTLCDECPRVKEYKRIDKIYLPHEVDIDPEKCLLDQGIVCLGPATRAGCGARCTRVGQPCRGCYGPTAAVQESGASMLSALASLFRISDKETQLSEDDILNIMSQVKDPLGYFYAFTMPQSLIRRTVKEKRRS